MKSGSRFSRHLEDVEESYFEHLRHALSFALAMLWGAVCCLIHALLPFLCEKSGSRIVTRLHDRMVVNRHRLGRPLREQDPESAAVGDHGKRASRQAGKQVSNKERPGEARSGLDV